MLFQRTFPPNFAHKGPKARGKKNHRSCLWAAGRILLSDRRASPVNGGLGGNAYEHRRKPGVHRRSPPVTLWFLSGDPERNPPRRAEPSKHKTAPAGTILRGRFFIRNRIYTSFTTPTNRVTPWLRSTNRKGRFSSMMQVSSGGAPAPMPNMVTAAASTPSSFTLTRVICWAWFR